MPNDLQTILMGASGATMGSNNGAAVTTPREGQAQNSPLLDALTTRLTQQGQGIASSASTNLQESINQAIKGSQKAGELSSSGLQIERDREIGFARDRAGATYTGAMEGRSGYATQVAGLRELTETTEKSIRDLDGRYQQAILSNDAATAQRIADLQLKKQEFLIEQEQNFYQNMFSAANLQESAMNRMMQTEQFWVGQERGEREFAMTMAQSNYQFQKNLGISYQELDLKSQSLDLERERNSISRAQYNLEKDKLNKEKSATTLQAMAYERMKNFVAAGGDPSGKDTMQWTTEFISEMGPVMPGLAEMEPEEVANFISQARNQISMDMSSGIINRPVATIQTGRTGGLAGAVKTAWSQGYSPIFQGISDFYLGKN